MSVFVHPVFRALAEKNVEVKVTLKNNISITGIMTYVDANLNLSLTPCNSSCPCLASMKKCFIRGSSVKFISISENNYSFALFDQLIEKEGEFV
jgi:small nuclear ribonucleoprotein (snRNP)-like protein